MNTREIREFDIGAKSDSPSPLLVQPGKDTCGKTISDASELALCRDSIFDPKEVPPGAVQAIATFLESAQSTSVYQDGSILRAGAARIVTPFPTPVRSARSSGIIAISDGGGHVVVALE